MGAGVAPSDTRFLAPVSASADDAKRKVKGSTVTESLRYKEIDFAKAAIDFSASEKLEKAHHDHRDTRQGRERWAGRSEVREARPDGAVPASGKTR